MKNFHETAWFKSYGVKRSHVTWTSLCLLRASEDTRIDASVCLKRYPLMEIACTCSERLQHWRFLRMRQHFTRTCVMHMSMRKPARRGFHRLYSTHTVLPNPRRITSTTLSVLWYNTHNEFSWACIFWLRPILKSQLYIVWQLYTHVMLLHIGYL